MLNSNVRTSGKVDLASRCDGRIHAFQQNCQNYVKYVIANFRRGKIVLCVMGRKKGLFMLLTICVHFIKLHNSLHMCGQTRG